MRVRVHVRVCVCVSVCLCGANTKGGECLCGHLHNVSALLQSRENSNGHLRNEKLPPLGQQLGENRRQVWGNASSLARTKKNKEVEEVKEVEMDQR